MEKVYSLFLIIAWVSFLGFAVENLWLGLTRGYMDNRSMVFPFLLGYGLAAVAIYLLLGTPEELSFLGKDIHIANPRIKRLLYFFMVMICVSLGEIILGKTVEKLCHIKWWDYSWLPLHITQYTSVFTSAGFSVMVVLFMDKAFMPLYYWHLTWNPAVLSITAVLLMTVMTVDFLYNACLMYVRKTAVHRWKINFETRLFHEKRI